MPTRITTFSIVGDMVANQTEIADTELFQMEFQGAGKWRIRTVQDKLWRPSIEGPNAAIATGVQAAPASSDPRFGLN